MKAFKVLDFDRRPMNAKGKKIIAATVIPLNRESLHSGNYIAVPSGKKVEVKSGGILAQASKEAKQAFALMRPRGVSLGESFLEIGNPFDEVYVEESMVASVKHLIFDCNLSRPNLRDFWIPANVVSEDGSIYDGWFKICESSVELFVINCEKDISFGWKVRAKNDENVALDL